MERNMSELTAVKERPILMNAEMVRAVLEDRKMQTRRVVKHQELIEYDESDGSLIHVHATDCPNYCDYACHRLCPYGQEGDRLWVRETFCEMVERHRPPKFSYRADTSADGEECRLDFVRCGYPYRWKPSIHMPRWASRITLEITGVRVERLQEISEADAIAEGVSSWAIENNLRGYWVTAFSRLWESINGPGSWATNPWVWVIEFRRL